MHEVKHAYLLAAAGMLEQSPDTDDKDTTTKLICTRKTEYTAVLRMMNDFSFKFPQVCLVRSLSGMRCGYRLPGFRQVVGGGVYDLYVSALLRCTLQHADVGGHFSVGWWGTSPASCALVAAILLLFLLLFLSLSRISRAFQPALSAVILLLLPRVVSGV